MQPDPQKVDWPKTKLTLNRSEEVQIAPEGMVESLTETYLPITQIRARLLDPKLVEEVAHASFDEDEIESADGWDQRIREWRSVDEETRQSYRVAVKTDLEAALEAAGFGEGR